MFQFESDSKGIDMFSLRRVRTGPIDRMTFKPGIAFFTRGEKEIRVTLDVDWWLLMKWLTFSLIVLESPW